MKLRITAAALSAAVLIALLSSCQLSNIIKKADTTADTTAPSGGISEIEDVEPMDLLNADLSQYIKLGQYKGIKVNERSAVVTDEMLEERISEILNDAAEYEQITDRQVQEGDVLNINFKGYMDGEQFEGGSADNQTITISEQSGYIKGFAEGLIGAMPGSTVRIDINFPEDYYEDLAGKPVSFDVTVNYIKGELIVPEFNDEFTKEHSGGKYSAAAEYKAYIRQQYEAELKAAAKSATIDDIWNIVLSNCEIISYPEQQVQYYLNMIKRQYLSYGGGSIPLETLLAYFGITEDDILYDAQYYTETDLVLCAIIKAEGITVSDEEYKAGLAQYAESYEVTEQELLQYYGEQVIRESLMKDKVFELLYEWADITVTV